MEDVAGTLQQLGIAPEAIEQALEQGDPEGAIFETVLQPQIAERTVSAAEIEERGGLSVDQVAALMEAFGFPAPDPEDAAFTSEEAHVFVELGRLEEVWPPELALQLARVYGRLLARIAQTALQLFRVYVAPRLRAEHDDPIASTRAVQQAMVELMPLADPLLVGVYRRWIEHEVAQELVGAAEVEVGERSLPGAVRVSFLFCDLKDFTAFADSEGDTTAVMAIDRFAATVTRERGEEFRFMKSLGDGFMLAYAEAGSAVAAGARIIDAMKSPRLPGVHASVHSGVAIVREGDYFGNAVNLAARLLNAARRDELIATRAVVESAGEEFRWEPAGTRGIRGVAEPCDVFLLAGYS